MKTIIFDIDGTLADIRHRLHYVKNGARKWDKFFAECVNDTPYQNVSSVYNELAESDREFYMVLVSGRSDIVRKETMDWLDTHIIRYDELHMRPEGDTRPDDIFKEEILDKLLAQGHDILCVFEDRQRVVDMWRRRGLTCLQVAAWEEKSVGVSLPKTKGLLTLMIGPSGAGKSSFLYCMNNTTATNLKIDSTHIVSSNQLRSDLCGNFQDQSKNAEVFAALHAVVKTRIDHGLPTVVDATNIKRADRMALVKMAEGSPVRYIVIDRPLEEKRRDGGWRNDIPGLDLIGKHHQAFQSQLRDILKSDSQPNVTVVDLRKV